jgi:hypothetical protein
MWYECKMVNDFSFSLLLVISCCFAAMVEFSKQCTEGDICIKNLDMLQWTGIPVNSMYTI